MDSGDLVLDGKGPIYLQIKRAIAGAVLRGEAGPGERIPSEMDLMARFGASRMTVHKAIAQLAAEGFLVRNRKAGTIVAQPRRDRAVFEIWDPSTEAAEAGARYRFEVIVREDVKARRAEARNLGVKTGAPMLRILGRHRINRAVVQVEERLINCSAVPAMRAADFNNTSPGRWLLDQVPWTEAEHTIHAVNATGRTAELLEVADGTAALLVERRTWNGRKPITFVRLWHPGDARVLVGRFSPYASWSSR